MSRDRSLDEFATGSEPGTGSPDAGETPRESGADGGDGAAEPIEVTYGWSPGGGVCGSCGATVEARWRDGEDLVCAECKEW